MTRAAIEVYFFLAKLPGKYTVPLLQPASSCMKAKRGLDGSSLDHRLTYALCFRTCYTSTARGNLLRLIPIDLEERLGSLFPVCYVYERLPCNTPILVLCYFVILGLLQAFKNSTVTIAHPDKPHNKQKYERGNTGPTNC